MWTENRFPPAGTENLFKNTFLLHKEKLALAEISEKLKKIVANGSAKSFK